MNPETRARLNTISRTLESANETAQENIYTFTQLYIDPCLGSLKACVYDCTAPCLPGRDENVRRKHGRSRGRDEVNFDFYDDWLEDEEAASGFAGWGHDELDSLLAGRGSVKGQPRKQRAMSYGSRPKRKGEQRDGEQDPTTIPSSSYFGFLERLPFQMGKRSVRYRPSAADLQENPGGLRVRDHEVEPLIEEDEEPKRKSRGHLRQRSDTQASRSTNASLSSRGDLIMSEEEEDAVPLDDEFAVMLTRRTTNSAAEDHSGGSNTKRPGQSRRSTRTVSSKSHSSKETRRSSSRADIEPLSPQPLDDDNGAQVESSSIVELQKEEERIRREEEVEIERKRVAARRLAIKRGLSNADEVKVDNSFVSRPVAQHDLENKSEPDSASTNQPQVTPPAPTQAEEIRELPSSVAPALRMDSAPSLPHALRDSAPPTPADEPFPEFHPQPISRVPSQLAVSSFFQDITDSNAEEQKSNHNGSSDMDKPP